jgi:hypothetical protein
VAETKAEVAISVKMETLTVVEVRHDPEKVEEDPKTLTDSVHHDGAVKGNSQRRRRPGEQDREKERLRENYERIERIKAENKLRQIRAGLNARKMSCECCQNENQCNLEGLIWNTKTKS